MVEPRVASTAASPVATVVRPGAPAGPQTTVTRPPGPLVVPVVPGRSSGGGVLGAVGGSSGRRTASTSPSRSSSATTVAAPQVFSRHFDLLLQAQEGEMEFSDAATLADQLRQAGLTPEKVVPVIPGLPIVTVTATRPAVGESGEVGA